MNIMITIDKPDEPDERFPASALTHDTVVIRPIRPATARTTAFLPERAPIPLSVVRVTGNTDDGDEPTWEDAEWQ